MITAWGDRCRGGDAPDIQTLMHLEPLSAMSTTAQMLMLTDIHRVTLRAAEGEETLLLICPPTHIFPRQSVNSRHNQRKGL